MSLWSNPLRAALRRAAAFPRLVSRSPSPFSPFAVGPYGDPFDRVDHFFRDWERETDRLGRLMMDSFIDDHFFDKKLKIREQAAQLSMDANTGLKYTLDVSGYQTGELKVEIEDGTPRGEDSYVTISGEHKDQTGDEVVHRQFSRSFRVPNGIKLETIKCDIDAEGHLCITAEPEVSEKLNHRRAIPIQMKVGVEVGNGDQAKASPLPPVNDEGRLDNEGGANPRAATA